MASFYPKFGEVELVLVEDENDFFDPLESNFECEDENEDVKLQLNDTIHEEDNFNLAIDDEDEEEMDERDAVHTPPPHDDQSNFHRKPRIKQEVSDHYGDNFTGVGAAKGNANKYGPIITPKCELNANMSDDSFDADDSHFYDNDSNHDDSAPIEIKPNLAELRSQANKSTAPHSRHTESMVSIPRNNSTITAKNDKTNESFVEKKVKAKKTANVDDDRTPKRNSKAKTKRKNDTKVKTTATITAAERVVDVDVDPAASGDEVAATTSKADPTSTEENCNKKQPKQETSVKVSAAYSLCFCVLSFYMIQCGRMAFRFRLRTATRNLPDITANVMQFQRMPYTTKHMTKNFCSVKFAPFSLIGRQHLQSICAASIPLRNHSNVLFARKPIASAAYWPNIFGKCCLIKYL